MCPARGLWLDYLSRRLVGSVIQRLKPFDMTLNKKIMFSDLKVVSNLNVIWLAIKRRTAKTGISNLSPANLH